MELTDSTPAFKSFGASNFRNIPQFQYYLNDEQRHAIEVISKVLPFKINNYAINELINWQDVPNDPIYRLLVPQREMLKPQHFQALQIALERGEQHDDTQKLIHDIRMELNPHPNGQMEHNVPTLHGRKLPGMQHKYKETVLVFPSHGQTCHSYCTFCFRWPQFIGIDELKFASNEVKLLSEYLTVHPEVSDVLITGGDPLIMNTRRLEGYIEPLLNIESVRTIRLGSKALGFWPYRFLTDKDADDLLRLFERIVNSGRHLAFMAHFSHPVEHKTDPVKQAIRRILDTGAQIRTQSPLIRRVNDKASVWKEMWQLQVNLRCVPYYFFLARDTGAHEYFAVPLAEAFDIYTQAYSSLTGLGRTARGPSMSTADGKVQIVGIAEVNNEKAFILQFIQGRNPDWVNKPFFAKYNESAIWLSDLRPLSGDKFFFED
jgi:L-lysine 2,3-aminomutase